jgi:hypothetical protein
VRRTRFWLEALALGGGEQRFNAAQKRQAQQLHLIPNANHIILVNDELSYSGDHF